jgi:hypothetical protein
MLLWFVAEFSDREFVEHFFFTIVFFSAASSYRAPLNDNARKLDYLLEK